MCYSAATGLTSHALLGGDVLRPVIVGLAAEGIRVGQSLGYALVPIYGAESGVWMAAAQGDSESAMAINRSLTAQLGRVTERERPSVAQDLLRGRRTEIEYTNGLLVRKAHDLGLAVPLQEAVLGLVRRSSGVSRPRPPGISRRSHERRRAGHALSMAENGADHLGLGEQSVAN